MVGRITAAVTWHERENLNSQRTRTSAQVHGAVPRISSVSRRQCWWRPMHRGYRGVSDEAILCLRNERLGSGGSIQRWFTTKHTNDTKPMGVVVTGKSDVRFKGTQGQVRRGAEQVSKYVSQGAVANQSNRAKRAASINRPKPSDGQRSTRIPLAERARCSNNRPSKSVNSGRRPELPVCLRGTVRITRPRRAIHHFNNHDSAARRASDGYLLLRSSVAHWIRSTVISLYVNSQSIALDKSSVTRITPSGSTPPTMFCIVFSNRHLGAS
ncbi:hypothetical protein Mal15_12240 [Stieleria maiorica]|uniref:Uncharacterized protein n=1 Tax=Stieleria maiorica TaxID=2795974 RepID=A0A5B9MAC6_9BACT|nr:hypothetical protein Mal15_12240 [Stieleria maiorica]